LYFEGFAGPGVYTNGKPGSPIVAIKSALEHILRPHFENKEIIFLMVEKEEDRANRLRKEIKRQCPNIPSAWTVEVERGDFVRTLEPVLDDLQQKGARLAPTFAFLDPFGFKDLPMDLVSRLLAFRWCDTLITFMARDINRFAEEPYHVEAVDRCLGSDAWRPQLPPGAEDRRSFFLRVYEEAIKARVSDVRVRSFEMSGQLGPIYYLVGATKHKEGVKVMKRAMWTTDPTGNYQFSDRTAGLRTLLQWEDEPAWTGTAMRRTYERFAGRTVFVEQVEDFVLYETPFEFKKRAILGNLELDGKIVDVRGRTKAGSWPAGCSLVFR
jgi:three-Cys-motif partner protein